MTTIGSQAVYVISVAAELAGMHPQTLRIYERRGLVNPARTQGGNRRYSDADIEVLRRITELAERGHEPRGHPPRDGARGRERAARAPSSARRATAARQAVSEAERASAATSCRCARRWPCSANDLGSSATTVSRAAAATR